MAHQATLKVSGPTNGTSAGILPRAARLGHDLLTIADLQMRLFALDLQNVRQRVLRGAAMLLVACALAIAVLPTALIGFGLLVAEVAHISRAAGLLSVGCGTGTLMVLLVIGARKQLSGSWAGFQRSQQELSATLVELRHVLLHFTGDGSAR